MRIIKQILWLIFFALLGEAIALMLQPVITIPASVLGMMIMFLAFRMKWLPLSAVEEMGQWLTSNMAIFFVPAGVGLMTQFSHLTGNIWWQLLVIIGITTALMMIIVGKIVNFLITKQETIAHQKGGRDDD